MAPSIVGNDAVQGEVFLPGQIFVFSGFALRANSLGHLAPGHQVRFRNLNYTADIHGDLIFDGFEPMPGTLHDHVEHDLALPSDSGRGITPAATPTLDEERIAPSKDGWIDPAIEAALSAAM